MQQPILKRHARTCWTSSEEPRGRISISPKWSTQALRTSRLRRRMMARQSSWLLLLALHMPPSATYSSEKGPGWLYHQNSYCQSSRLSISPWKYHTSNSFPCSAVCSQMGYLGFMRFLCLSPKRPLTMLWCHNTWLYPLFCALWCDGFVWHVFGDNEHQNLMKLPFPICS